MDFLTYTELEQLLSPFRCTRKFKADGNFEVWATGWGQPFTLSPTAPHNYTEDQVRRALKVLADTLPIAWWKASGSIKLAS